jgi:hypothetical protein
MSEAACFFLGKQRVLLIFLILVGLRIYVHACMCYLFGKKEILLIGFHACTVHSRSMYS